MLKGESFSKKNTCPGLPQRKSMKKARLTLRGQTGLLV